MHVGHKYHNDAVLKFLLKKYVPICRLTKNTHELKSNCGLLNMKKIVFKYKYW